MLWGGVPREDVALECTLYGSALGWWLDNVAGGSAAPFCDEAVSLAVHRNRRLLPQVESLRNGCEPNYFRLGRYYEECGFRPREFGELRPASTDPIYLKPKIRRQHSW